MRTFVGLAVADVLFALFALADRLRVRSWFILPGLLTSSSPVAKLHGDGAAAWRLEAGVVSGWGVAFWILAAAGIAAVLLRRRRLPDDGAADAHGVGGGVARDERQPDA